MKIYSIKALAVAFALALMPGLPAMGHGGGGHGGGGGWGGGGHWGGGGWGGGYYGGYGWGDPFWYDDYGYPYYGYPYYSDAPVHNPSASSGSLITQVQEILAKDGYYQSTVDGVIGPMTRAAIGSYQIAHNLQVTRRIDETLLHALGLI